MSRLLDQYGRPVDLGRLTEREAVPTLTGIRSVLSDHPSRGLTPQRLTSILLEAEEGDATRYLELAEDIEEKDLHYLAQLNTRKRAVAQLQISVESATDAAQDVGDADVVRDFLRRDDLEDVLFHILDAAGKGFSVCEIEWERSARVWMPLDLHYVDPRWFAFDALDGRTLKLREGAELVALAPYKYIVHTHQAKSGLPIRGGLARAAAWSYLFKTFTLKDWVALAEIFGQPFRVGKYHASATDEDRRTLLRAVASIGTDAAAIIPEGMMIDFIEAGLSGSIDLYERLCGYLDAQVSKVVLGQTLTSDVSSSGGSRALGEVHDKVRRDIMRSDARQLAATLNRCLVRPLVDLNRGPRQNYPRLVIGLPDELTTTERLEQVRQFVPMGLQVEESVVRDLLGFADPPADAALLAPAAAGAPDDGSPPGDRARQSRPALPIRAAHSARGAGDAIDEAVDAILEEGGWVPVVDPLLAPVRDLLDRSGSLEEFREGLAGVLATLDIEALSESVARGSFTAYLAGELELDLRRRA